MYNLHKNDR